MRFHNATPMVQHGLAVCGPLPVPAHLQREGRELCVGECVLLITFNYVYGEDLNARERAWCVDRGIQ